MERRAGPRRLWTLRRFSILGGAALAGLSALILQVYRFRHDAAGASVHIVALIVSLFIFSIQAAHTPRQRVVSELLKLSPGLEPSFDTEPCTQGRFMRLRAPRGEFMVGYTAVLELTHFEARPDDLQELSPRDLPAAVLPYLYPSRYCQSDRLLSVANLEFGQLQPGYGRAQAICNWVQQHVRFQGNTSNSVIN